MEKKRRAFSYYIDEVVRRIGQAVGGVGEASALAEPQPARPATERLVQCIWFDSLFLHDGLRTDDGQTLEIVQPGRWNEEEGPDFRDARLKIADAPCKGDVEIHLTSAGWRQHRHHMNPEYDNVVLHAYLWREADGHVARNSRGECIPGFYMEPALFPDLESIRQTLQVEDYPYQTPSTVGRCQPLMCSLDEVFVGDMLESAGRERIEGKAARFSDQSLGETLEQVFYQSLMTSMGHKANKALFFLLSKRAPLAELADYARDIPRAGAVSLFQSILLHVAQLAPQTPLADVEAAHYIERLRSTWTEVQEYFTDRIIPPTRQWLTGVRPVNFAYRRLAGVAHLLDRLFLDEGILDRFLGRLRQFDPVAKPVERRRWILSQMIEPFVVDAPEDFWARRYTFTSNPAPRAMKLVGEDRAASVAFNALLPILLIEIRRRRDGALEDRLWEIAESWPPLESNAIVRHMRARLFGEDNRGRALLDTELRQQGLFQIFASCCNHNETGCDDCYYQRVHL